MKDDLSRPAWMDHPLDYLSPLNRDPLAEAAAAAPRQSQAATTTQPAVATPAKSLTEQLETHHAFGCGVLKRKPFEKSAALMFFRRVRSTLASGFGSKSPVCKALEADIQGASKSPVTPGQLAEKLTQLQTLIGHLQSVGESPLALAGSEPSRPPITDKVFVVHGHDETNTLRLDRLLRDEFKLNPVIMRMRPGMSRPLTNKFEENARTCSFAFGLFTPDDTVVKGSSSYYQARPNVIYEVGWFIGRLGPSRVLLILKEQTKIHSDLDGVSQVRFADNVEDRFLEIQTELRAANLIT